MAETADTRFLKQYGERLLQQGYPIVPIKKGFKFPKGLSKWEKITANENHLNKWLSNGFADGGVGVITKEIPAVDIDVYDEDITSLLVAWCEENIGATVKRVGESPKVLLVYRTEKPIKKIISTVYEDFLGLTHKIEILGDGQQFVAFAMHPDTGKPYEWVTEKNLADVNRKDLPILTEEKALELVAYYESIVPDDWIVAEKGQRGKEIDFTLSTSERIFLHSKPKVDISTQKLIKALNMLDPNMGNADWVRVGMAVFHQYDGDSEGFEIYDNWSSGGDTYDPENIVDRWRSFKADLTTTDPVTASTIILMAKEAYKKKKAKEEVSRGFNLVHASKILAKLGPVNWQVKNYFEADTTGILFGDPGSYKSFIAMDIGIHCALGRDWNDNEVKQGAVIYVAGEGHGGFARRLAAFEKAHNVSIDESLPLYFSEQAASLYNEESALLVTEAIDTIVKATGAPTMLIIDTLARNFGAGDENSTSDMNVFIENVDRQLRDKYGCTVLIVHHTGHSNKERARGAMALKGALDFEYRIEKPDGFEGYAAKMFNTKMKDAPAPEDTWFEGESVVVGTFDDDEMTSLVFRKTSAPVQEEVPLKNKQKACYELLKSSVIDGEGIEKKAFQKMLVDAEISNTNAQARNLVNTLTEKGYLIEFEGFLRVDDFSK